MHFTSVPFFLRQTQSAASGSGPDSFNLKPTLSVESDLLLSTNKVFDNQALPL